MGSKLQQGFTIIEVMLFLAITGLLLAGVMVGASNNLNAQHYRDGAEGLRQQIASQFDKVYSLTNNNLSSGGEGDSSDPCVVVGGGTLAPNIPRGTSDCFYVGRLLQVSPSSGDGSTLKISPVIAKRKATASAPLFGSQTSGAATASQGASDIASRYQIALYDKNSALVSSETLNWGLAAVGQRPHGGVASRIEMNILILRSPIDGNITTYVVDTSGKNTSSDPNHLENQFDVDHSKEVTICVADLSGNLDPTDRMGVIIHRAATGPGDVESKTVGSGC